MNEPLLLLLSSPWFWIVLVLIVLIIAFRAQLARLIDRLQKASVEAGKEGAKIAIESPIPVAPEKPPAVAASGASSDASPASSPPPAAAGGAGGTPAGPSVEVGHGAQMENVTIGDIGNVIIKPAADKPARAAIKPTPATKPAPAAGWTPELLRELLTAAFSDEELTTLCFDHFRPVYEGFSTGMSKGQKQQRLLEHCESYMRTNELLELVRQRNPNQFARFQARVSRG